MVTHPTSSITFNSFNQPPFQVYPYFGEYIVLLLDEANHQLALTDLNSIDLIVSIYDKCFEFYQSCFENGDKPSNTSYMMEGRVTVCVVSNGAGGLGIVGGFGVEIGPAFFETTFKNVKYGLNENFYHVLFYEFGRNWWLTSNSLTCQETKCNSSFIDGYAIFMQIWAMKYCNISGGFYSGQPFSVHNLKILQHVTNYELNNQANWENTLQLKRGADFAEHYGCELWAGFMHYMSIRFGGLSFVQRIFKIAKKLTQQPLNPQQVLDNWFISCSKAAQKNLTLLFTKRWRMNVSHSAIEQIQQEFRISYEYDQIEKSSNPHSQISITNQHVSSMNESNIPFNIEFKEYDANCILIGLNLWTGHIIDSIQPIYGKINQENGQLEYVREGEKYGTCGGKLERMEFKGYIPTAIHYENGYWYGNKLLCRIGIEFQEWNSIIKTM
ncbi:predicted protein [Naegleria gruberi]|uniref:Predicted protein n=1 Tax=Naegleria gruberi TaxID=5762 RepID=D2W3X7_NAEGR|nr:uncharacterized protein NAEGRDRAFT_76103 [Naegleria gruberi]EFC36196.1 predicted protein [Naegleria gruberi]|eukprot:XP_002668940.1 predicted protein [Naegleria gruberi strain NEG-M]